VREVLKIEPEEFVDALDEDIERLHRIAISKDLTKYKSIKSQINIKSNQIKSLKESQCE